MMTTQNNPEDPEAGTREVAFSRELFIERDDFMENPPKNYFRLTPGQEVRLKSAYIVKCTGCKKDDNGEIMEVYCEYDPLTKSGMPESNRKVKGTLHWVSAAHCVDADVRLYDRLFNVENPSADERDFRELLNPDSLQILTGCKLENSLKNVHPLEHFQFQRIGYFTVDLDSTPNKLIFNRTVSLKDSWSKELNK
jgi:glutaminyl-tRNA synthetase